MALCSLISSWCFWFFKRFPFNYLPFPSSFFKRAKEKAKNQTHQRPLTSCSPAASAPPTSCHFPLCSAHFLSSSSPLLFHPFPPPPSPSKVPTSPNFPRTLGTNSQPRRLGAERDPLPFTGFLPGGTNGQGLTQRQAGQWTRETLALETPHCLSSLRRDRTLLLACGFSFEPGWAWKQA